MNLLLIVATGLLIQHRDVFGLENRYVTRRFLPSGYRPNDGPEIRSDIVITDLHSGRILGTTGVVILDAITLGWLVLLMTGVSMHIKRASSLRKAGTGGGPNANNFPSKDIQSRGLQ
jgi:hypothetical protein